MNHRIKRTFILLLITIFLAVATIPVTAQDGQPERQAPFAVEVTESEISWQPQVSFDYAASVLTVSGPDDFYSQVKFDAGEAVIFKTVDEDGEPLLDGVYNFEIYLIPVLSSEATAALQAAMDSHDPAVLKALIESGEFPAEAMGMAGTFAVNDGSFVIGDETEAGVITADIGDGPLAPDDQVFLDDLIVQGSICAGFDCVNGESFGFDTLRLKENNLRIKAQDTSTSASFPSNDWQITFNDSSNGGRNMFAIDDVSGGRTPFLIEAGARTNALYVDDGGRIGIGTNTPVANVHIKTGNTPTTRLEQDGTSGFTAQTWDVAGNEANFFIRDASNGSTLPFRIRPGAPSSSIDIAGGGNVGIGLSSPQAKLHVNGNAILNGLLIEASDVNLKENLEAVDADRVLLALANLPLYTWSYIADNGAATHIGPTAQDFYAAYGLGFDDKHIAPLDTNGVSLAAIQALYQQLLAQQTEIGALQAQNTELAERLATLEALVQALLDAQSGALQE